MELYIDGLKIIPGTGKSLLELVKELELDRNDLATRPLAAKTAGEVFTLNYIPVREKEASGERPSMRRAMASDVAISLAPDCLETCRITQGT